MASLLHTVIREWRISHVEIAVLHKDAQAPHYQPTFRGHTLTEQLHGTPRSRS